MRSLVAAEALNGAGNAVVLGKPLKRGGLRTSRDKAPRYWRCIVPALAGSASVPEPRLNDWLLVLAAKNIPHVVFPAGARTRIYVPALYEKSALQEISEFEQERPVPIFVPPVRDNFPGVCLFLFLLLVWHGLRWHWFDLPLPSPALPGEPSAWVKAFGMDVYRTRVLHEWWRVATALTLHADDSHLFSNLGFGLLFLYALCRRAGLGLGVAMVVLAGSAGNACNSLFKSAHVISLGFSTSLFGALGCLCALAAADIVRHQHRHAAWKLNSGLALQLARRLAMPLAAGMALLGILGGGGEAKTDYSAHIFGFCCGAAVTIPVLPLERRIFALPEKKQSLVQAALFLGTLAFMAFVWAYALHAR